MGISQSRPRWTKSPAHKAVVGRLEETMAMAGPPARLTARRSAACCRARTKASRTKLLPAAMGRGGEERQGKSIGEEKGFDRLERQS